MTATDITEEMFREYLYWAKLPCERQPPQFLIIFPDFKRHEPRSALDALDRAALGELPPHTFIYVRS